MSQRGRGASFLEWLDERLPVAKFLEDQLLKYYAPKNFNFLYFFGSLALLVLVNQIVTGIVLAMHYKPAAELAFDSVEYIMRDVNWGWLLRYLHSTGASLFFVVIYMHMFRGIFYGSFKKPRELLWLFGMVIFVLLMAEAFMGYLLPWGQMSYWGAQVIISLFGAIPVIGEDLATWIRGDFVIADATLNRFFALHVIAVPLAILGLVVLHLAALRTVGSNNPDGIEIKKNRDLVGIPKDGIPFHPYYTVKDLYVAGLFLTIFAWIVFYSPEMGGLFLEHPNFDPADPMKTPEHIQPVWYFTPFYSILRAIPSKLGGVAGMGASIVVLFLLPWLDRCPVKSIRYRSPLFKIALTAFIISFLGLGVLGTKPVTETYTLMARGFSVIYFSFFLLLPIFSSVEITKEVPQRLTESVLPLAKREGFQWRLIEEGIAALQHSPFFETIKGLLSKLRGNHQGR
ncbi:MAG: cytochrome bc complex cytochrome b subunit [Gammaproteobacteria bacterium]|jgi:ubiquinol-cytochrome c reductase cytochrome b subunit|nr:cytochrome bc complex cytochrome b subunit [Gammaproteobacteria bacterium]NBT44182.1 cytochrome bc complex cytochrome b subunit [Gammaproteobacteria bacterium]NBY22759.1 cytochrome bc complex cytochrome b subunit [Gammaproteobacteria bacterium]